MLARGLSRAVAVLVASAVAVIGLSGVADADEQAGPPLQASPTALAAAVSCTSDVEDATVNPVLLVHGTGGTPQDYWSWNYQRALPALGIPVCTVALPQRALISFPVSSEYVVYAVRHVHELSGRKVSLLGHSQGGTQLLWALRFWPDLAGMVDDVVAISSDFHGTAVGNVVCALPCSAIAWQARIGSKHLARMVADPLPAGPSYTTIQTVFDEVVTPAPAAGRLDGAANFTIQQFCPGRVAEHLSIVPDAVAWRIALDALTHDGPAVKSRVAANCAEVFMPSTNPVGALGTLTTAVAAAGGILGITQPRLRAEPALPSYAASVAED